jgi:hypothetical protein
MKKKKYLLNWDGTGMAFYEKKKDAKGGKSNLLYKGVPRKSIRIIEYYE